MNKNHIFILLSLSLFSCTDNLDTHQKIQPEEKFFKVKSFSNLIHFRFEGLDKNSVFPKGRKINCEPQLKEGPFKEMFLNSSLIYKSRDPGLKIEKQNGNRFSVFIDSNYALDAISFDVFILPKPHCHIETSFTKGKITYPDTLYIFLQNFPIDGRSRNQNDNTQQKS